MECIARSIRNEEEIHKGNRILLIGENGNEVPVKSVPGVNVIFKGANSLVRFYEPLNIKSMQIQAGEGAFLDFGKNFRVRQSLYINASARNTTIQVLGGGDIGTASFEFGDDDNLELIIGENFLSAMGLYIRGSDGHVIFDKTTKEILNRTEVGIHIGNHVWAGYNVIITKDADIPNGCVLGAGSVVGKRKFDCDSIIAGVPAKVIRTGIEWNKKTITRWLAENE